jgi:hypothetical protein
VTAERGPYRTLEDVLAACDSGTRDEAVKATMQYLVETTQAELDDYPELLPREAVVRVMERQGDKLRWYLSQPSRQQH